MAKSAPGAAFRITEPLTHEEEEEWRQAEEQYTADVLAATRRRESETPAFTEEQLDEAERLLKQLNDRHTRPEQFTGDLAASAPPVYADGDDPADRRDPAEYSSQMAAVAPTEALVMAPFASVLHKNPYSTLCVTEITRPMQRVLDTFNTRLRCARLSKTEFADVRDIVEALGFLQYVRAGENSLHLFSVYGRYAATCQLVSTDSGKTLLIAAYCFTVAPED